MKHLILTLVVLFNINSFSQKSGKALLKEVSDKVNGYKNISIDFKYVLENTSENIKQETRGDVVLEGDKYKLNILGVTRLFDGKTLYNISPEDEEVTVSTKKDDDEDIIAPSKMLSFYENGYTSNMDIIQDVKGRKIQYVKLVPMSSKDQRKEIILGIDSQTKNIYNLIEIGKKGTKTTLTVNSFKTNQPLSKNQFIFVWVCKQ